MQPILDAIEVWWLGVSAPIKASLIGIVGSILTSTIAALVVVWQIGRQAKNAIAQNKQNEATKLKLEQYDALAQVLHKAMDTANRAMQQVRGFQIAIDSLQGVPAEARSQMPPKERIPHLVDQFTQVNDDAIAVKFWVERWAIIEPRIDVFSIAISVALHDYATAWNFYVGTTSSAMPTDTADGKTHWNYPAANKIAAIREVGDRLISALMNLESYMADFQTEMQNQLVGPLFGHTLSFRKPSDPTLKVIDLSKRDELMSHFQNDTEWGRAQNRARDTNASRLAAREADQSAG